MSFAFHKTAVVSEVKESLPQMVTDAKKTASSDEHSMCELAGQAIHVQLEKVDDDDDAVIELNAYGSNVPSTGEMVFNLSMAVRRVKSKPKIAQQEEVWTPDKGPLALRNGRTVTTAEAGSPTVGAEATAAAEKK